MPGDPSRSRRPVPCRSLWLHVGAWGALALPLATWAQDPTLQPTVVRAAATAAPVPGTDMDVPVATGSRLNLSIRATPASVYQVDRASMEARGDRTTQEALRGIPGIVANGKPDVGGFVSWRGFAGSQITQLFNGISMQYDVVAARPVDSWIYDRVEAVGGPSAFLFGAGAVGGSINYVTRLPERGTSSEALVRAGAHGTAQAAIGLNRVLAGDAQQGHFLRLDANVQRSAGRMEGNVGRTGQVAASLLSDLSGSLTHTLAVERHHEDIRSPYWGTPLRNPVGEGRILEGTRFRNYNSSDGLYAQDVTWARSILEWRSSDRLRLKNTLYGYSALRDYQNVEEYGFNAGNTAVERMGPLLQRHEQELVGNRIEASLSSTLAGRPSDWVFGIDASRNRQTRFPNGPAMTVSTVDPYEFTTESFFDIPGMTRDYAADREVAVRTLALFAENRTRLADGVSLVSGLRADRIELELTNRRAVTPTSPASLAQTYKPVTGRVGLVWDWSPQANLYVQYATAADPPAGVLTTASFAQARTNTELTRGRQLEVGSKFGLFGGRALGSVAVYRIERSNLAAPDPAAPARTVLVGRQSSRGIEAGLDARLTARWNVQANLALVDAQFDDFSEMLGGIAVSRAGRTPPNTPLRVAKLWTRYAFAPGWDASAGVRAASGIYGDNANTVRAPGHAVLDLGLDWRYSSRVTLRARVRNATDKVYANHVTHTPMFHLGDARTFDVALRASF